MGKLSFCLRAGVFSFLLLFVLFSCESPLETSSSTETSSNTVSGESDFSAVYEYSSETPFYQVNFTGSSGILTVSGLQSQSVYLVKVNKNLVSSVSSANSGTVTTLSSQSTQTGLRSLSLGSSKNQNSVQVPSRGPINVPKTAVETWNASPPKRSSTTSRSLVKSTSTAVLYGDTSAYTVGSSTKSFYVEDASGNWISVSATLRALGQYCYVWVPEASYNTTSSQTSDGGLTQAQIDSLAEAFDGTAANSYGDGIYKLVSNVFGYERGGSATGDGGIDGDQHISILLYDIDYDSSNGSTLGYFWAKDDYTQAELDSYGVNYKSNSAEIFYLDSYYLDAYAKTMYSTLAHEFQHMIHYNQKVYEYEAADFSSSWFNEMCSMVAEDLVADKLGLSDSEAPYYRLEEFSYHYAESGVVDWWGDSSSSSAEILKSYASAYAFGAYLLRNYGGPALFSAMVRSAYLDEAAISQALVDLNYDDDFEAALENYAQALVFTDAPTGSSVKTLKKTGSWTLDGDGDGTSLNYSVKALDFDTVAEYNLNSWAYVKSGGAYVYGPRLYGLSSTQSLRPAGFLIVSDDAWQDVSGSLSLTLVKPANEKVEYYIFVK